MNLMQEHPSLNIAITEEQRERGERWLQDAYAAGRISESEFERRIEQALSAVTRRDLNLAFYGLVEVSAASQALGVHPAYRPLTPVGQSVGRGAASVAHFSGLISWIFGPVLVYMVSPVNSFARREAAKAFNFQLVAMLGLIVSGIVAGMLDSLPGIGDAIGMIPVLVWLGWLILTVVGGAKAAQGEDWTNPVTKAARIKVLSGN